MKKRHGNVKIYTVKKKQVKKMTLEILYKSENVIVIYKPPFISSEGDAEMGENALSITKGLLRNMGEREELFIINRLDNVVGGLVLLARNKRTAAILSKKVENCEVIKEYFAVADGIAEEGILEDHLIKDRYRGTSIRVEKDDPSAKRAVLNAERLAVHKTENSTKSLLNIRLITGRFHQIRCQLSLRGTPLTGDKKYGSKDLRTRGAALFAYHIAVITDEESIDVYKLPDVEKHPWNLFSASEYNLKVIKNHDE